MKLLLNLFQSYMAVARTLVLFVAICLMVMQQGCSPGLKNSSSPGISIEPRSSWKAMEAKPFTTHNPVRITIHHEGTKMALKDDAAKKINAIQRWGMGPEKKWSDIPYHFLIAPGGIIYEGRNVFTVGETSTEYNPYGHLLISCLGNLDTDTVPAAQLHSLIQLISYSSKKYKIPIDSLGTHKDFSSKTNCPGKNLDQYFENGYIKQQIKKLR
jgi:N-acetylmuramoyl-L-alanine amidase